METLYVVIIFALVILGIFMFSRCGSSTSVENIRFPVPVPGQRPSLGNFLPVMGDVPTTGKYEFEDLSPMDRANFCVDCKYKCMNQLAIRGESRGLTHDMRYCTVWCDRNCYGRTI